MCCQHYNLKRLPIVSKHAARNGGKVFGHLTVKAYSRDLLAE